MKKLSFLLADDDFDDREFFQKKLHELSPGAKLTMVTDGKQAIDYLDHCKSDDLPCAVILDYNMPNMDGAQVLDWLCNHSCYDGITRFIWSTAHNREYIDECKDKGAHDYFVKPNNEKGLTVIVQKLVAYCKR